MADTYTTRPGDQWDIIAKRVYGKEQYADFLMSNNFKYLDIYEFDAGVELSTPELPNDDSNVLPEWRKES